MNALVVGSRFKFPLSNIGSISNNDIRRLSVIGLYFVVLDIENCMDQGIIKTEKDVICFTTGLDYHGSWKLERKVLEDLLNVYKGRT